MHGPTCQSNSTERRLAAPSCTSLLLGHAPLGHEVVLVVVLHAAPDAEAEVRESRVHADVPVEVLVRLVKHAAIVAGVDIVPPAVLGRVDVHLRHTLHAHLLEVPPM